MRKLWLPLVCLLLSGCSATAHKGPVLISFADQQRASISPAVQGDTYDSIADRLANLPQEVYAGSTTCVSEVILNKGSASRGIRILIKGSALTDGLFDSPNDISVSGIFDDKSHPDVTRTLSLTESNAGLQARDEDLPYGSKLRFIMTLPAVRGGNGDLQIFVYPLDKNGQSTAVITHNYKVLSETAEPQEIQVPGE